MLLQKVNLIYEQIQKQGKIWKKLKQLNSSADLHELGSKLGQDFRNFLKGDVQLKWSLYILEKYLPRIKYTQLKQIVTTCATNEQISVKNNICYIDPCIYLKELLKTCGNLATNDQEDCEDFKNTLTYIKDNKYSPFFNYSENTTVTSGYDLANKLIKEYKIQDKLDQCKFKSIIDPKTEQNINIDKVILKKIS